MSPLHSDRVTVDVLGKELTVEIEGITPLEAPVLSKHIADKADELKRELNLQDTLALQRFLIVELAAEVYLLNSKMENFDRAEEKAIERMSAALGSAL
ncbi:MAG: hypothetical protein AAB339_02295 [Elusimicrobiota bacterium]